MSERRSELETEIQRRIQIEIGSEPDLLLLRNSVGQAKHVDEKSGTVFQFPYGLGVGSPDLVGLLRRPLRRIVLDGGLHPVVSPTVKIATWFCLEVKCPGEVAREDQEKSHAIWRRFGAFIEVVTSPKEARAALNRAREWGGIAA